MNDLSAEFGNPAIQEYIKNEYHRGLRLNDCLGLHGTSIEALRYVLQNGVLPGETQRGKNSSDVGDVFYTRIHDTVTEEAVWYAKKNACRHYLKSKLGLDFTSYADDAVVDLLLARRPTQIRTMIISGLQMNEDTMEALIAESEAQQGLIMGFSHKVKEDYEISKWGRYGIVDGMRIDTKGEGLPFSYIYGIVALGERERNFLDTL